MYLIQLLEYNVLTLSIYRLKQAYCFLCFNVDNYLYPLCVAIIAFALKWREKETITTTTISRNKKSTQQEPPTK